MARSKARFPRRALAAALAMAVLVSTASIVPALAADPDTTAPTAPGDLHVVSRTKGGALTLGWTASYDAVGVAGYRMYRDGTWIGTLTQAGVDRIGAVWYDRLTGRTKTAITYRLYAYDAAGNDSAPATLVVAP